MTDAPMLTTSKKRMVPELIFLSECAPQLSITWLEIGVVYALLLAMFSLLHSATNIEQYQKCL